MTKPARTIAFVTSLWLTLTLVLPELGSQEPSKLPTKPLQTMADELAATVVTPHLEAPVQAGKNLLWCATFQLAFNELATLVGEDLSLEKPSPMLDGLGKKAVTKDAVDDTSSIAMAGFVKDGIVAKINAGLAGKFPGSKKTYTPAMAAARPDDIVAYSFLSEHLAFATPFESLNAPLVFGTSEVHAFGISQDAKGSDALYSQVSVIDYQGKDDFVIELLTTSEGHRVILAKTKPGATLGDTTSSVMARVEAGKPEPLHEGDVLAVPRFDFDVTTRYDELLGSPLVTKNPSIPKGTQIIEALQRTKLELDEKGVTLESTSEIALGCSSKPSPTHELVFDAPFLVMLAKKGSSVPYFALWVDNTELMVR